MSIRNLFRASRKTNNKTQLQESRRGARRNALRKRLLGHETLEDRRLLAVYSNPAPITINDDAVATPYPSTINVAGLTGNVIDVDVQINDLNHTFPDDVGILLVGPGGQSTLLMGDSGGTFDLTNVNLTFDDAAASGLPDNAIISSGAFQPTLGTVSGGGITLPLPLPGPAPAGPYGMDLAAFNGSAPNGNWQLFVLDDSGSDAGSIAGGWSLDIITSDAVFDGDGTDNDFTVQVNPGDNTLLDVIIDGNTRTFARGALNSLTFNGLGGDDTLTVDYVNGNPIPAAGIEYSGGAQGAGGDTLVVNDGTFTTVTSNYTNANDGNVDLDGSVITYTGLEPVLLNAGTVANIIFNLPAGANPDVLLADDTAANFPGNGLSAASTSAIDGSTFEYTSFTNPTTSLTVNGNTSADAITLQAMDAAYAADTNINMEDGDDTVVVLATTAATTTAIDTEAGSPEQVYIGVTAGNENTGVGSLANIAGNVTITDFGTGMFVYLDNSADVADRDWTVSSPAANRGLVSVSGIGGTIQYQTNANRQIDLIGGDGDDEFTVDLSGGNIDDPLPSTNLDIFGRGQAAGGDSLVLMDTVNTHGTVTHNFTNDNDGTVIFNSQTPKNDTIRYEGLEPILDNLDVNNRVFNFAMASAAIELTQFDATHTRIESPVNEMVDFTTPNTSLDINLASGVNTITVTDLAGDYDTLTNTIDGNDGVDTVNFERLANAGGGSNWTVNGGGGSDIVNLSPVAEDLDNLLGTVTFNGDSGPGADADADVLNVNDDANTDGDTFVFTATSITRPTGTNFLGATYDIDVNQVNLDAGLGDDTINVTSTTSAVAGVTVIDGQEGNDTFNITGSGLGSGSNTFNGDQGTGADGNDRFFVALDTAGGLANPATVNGDGQVADFRDEVEIVETAGAARTVDINYTTTDLVTIAGIGALLTVTTSETLGYSGTGANDDVVNVNGAAAEDTLLTVAPIAPDRAIVFNGGLPFDGPPQDFSTRYPGIAGGSVAPDLDIRGVLNLTGLNIADAGGTDDILYIYGESENGLTDAAGTLDDPFGFGVGLLLPAVGVPAAYDTIDVTDTATTVDALLRVNYNTTDFVRTDATNTPAVVVNAGDEPTNPGPTVDVDVADDITLSPSAAYRFQINGIDPDPATTGIVPPDGDRLNVTNPGSVIDIYSDKATPPNVSVAFPGSGFLPFGFSSIENLALNANNGTVNLIGDNGNAPGTDQTDNFVVVGRDIDALLGPGPLPADAGQNEMAVMINGSNPIFIDNVEFLNAFGHEEVDTLEITPYADDTPRGWGIDVFYDEGLPAGADGDQADLLIVHTSLFGGMVSEDIVIRPSGPDNGEVVITNGSFGTPIVDIDYVGNTDIIVLDDDGFANDTDTLTLLGTNPDNPGTSGNETVVADFTAAGTLVDPLITFNDGATILYRLRNMAGFDALSFDLLGGNDRLTVVGQNNGAGIAIDTLEVFGGTGNDTLILDNSDGLSEMPGGITYHGGGGDDQLLLTGTTAVTTATYNVGPTVDAGTVVHTLGGTTQTVNFTGLEPVIDLVPAAMLVINATNADNAISYEQSEINPAWGKISIDGFEPIHFANKTNVVIKALGGSDAVSLNNPSTPTGLTGITVHGGNPSTGSDSVEIIGTAADDTFAYTPTASDGGTVVQGGAIAMTYNLATVESLAIDAVGQAANDSLTVTTANAAITPGTDPGTGVVDPVSATGAPLLSASYAGMETATVTGTTVVVQGTAEDDTITVSAAGIVTVTNELGFTNSVDVSGFTNVVINALGGDDAITITPSALAISIIGGDNGDGSDTLTFNGTGGAVTLDLGAKTVTEAGMGAVSYTGIEHLNVNTGAGALLINGTAGSDNIEVTPNAGGGVLQANGDSPEIIFTATGAVTVDPLGGNDTVRVNGDAAANTFAVSDTAVTVDALTTINLTTANLEALDVRGGEGSDIFNVVQSATVAISVLGGNPIGVTGDTLNLTPTGAVMFTAGAENDEGGFTAAGGAAVSFDEIEALSVALGGGAAGVATIMGTGADDHITATGTAAGTVDVQVNDGPIVTYTAATSLTLQGKNGDDDIVVDPGVAGLGVNFTVDGGSATAGTDTLTVDGLVNVVDAFTYTPTNSDSGSVAIAGLSTVAFTDIEQLEIDGQNGNLGVADTLDINTINIDGTQVLTPGAQFDAGDVEFRDGGFLTSTATPIAFQRLGLGGSLTFSDVGRFDNLIYRGTDLNDTFSVDAAGQVLLNTQIAVNTPSIITLTLAGLEGDDTFDIVGNHNLPGIAIQGGDPDSGSDTLNFTGAGAAVTVDLAAKTITEAGFGAVSYAGVEHVNVDSTGGALSVTGTLGNDTYTVTPLGAAMDGRFTHNLSPGVDFTYDNSATVTFADVLGGGGVDTVEILGDEIVDTITATAATVTVDGSTVTIGGGIEAMKVFTLGGNDNIDLTGFTNGAAAMNVEIHAGEGNDTVRGSDLADVIYGGAGNDILIGGLGNDFQYGEDGNDIFGNPTVGADGAADDPGQDFNFGGAGFDNFIWEPGDGPDVNNGGGDAGDVFRFFGNAGANVFTLRAGGTPTHFNALIGVLVIDNHGIEDVRVDGQGGADTFDIQDLYETEVVSVNLLLGDADGAVDAVTVAGRTTGDDLVVTSGGQGSNVSIEGLTYDVNLNQADLADDTLTINGNEGDDSILVESGVQMVLTSTLNGNAGDDLLSGWFNNASGGAGNDTFVGAPLALPLIQTMDGGIGDDSFTGNGGTNEIIGGADGDTIHVPGTNGDDTIRLFRNAAGDLFVDINGTVTTYLTGIVSPGSDIEQIRVDGLDGDDELIVDVTATGLLYGPTITFDGGDGSDLLTTRGNPTTDVTTVTYTPGQAIDEGRLVYEDGEQMTIDFVNLEPVVDLIVAASLVVNGTNAANAINYDQSPNNAAWGRVSVDGFETIEFAQKQNLTINGLAGSDEISLNNPTAPALLTSIRVIGGDPTAGSDVAIVSGTTGADVIDFAPTTDNDAVITGAGPVVITLAGIESAVIDGQGGFDNLTYTTAAVRNDLTYTPGASPDSGSIVGIDPSPLMPLSFTELGVGANSITLTNAGGRVDSLQLRGTDVDDSFNVTAAGVLRIQTPFVFKTLPINTPGIAQVSLQGLEGDDTFNVPGNHPFTGIAGNGIRVEGGNPDSGSDVLNFTGAGAVVTVDLGLQTVTEAGFIAVAYSGVETINADAGGVGLNVVATGEDDDVTVTVFDANSGKVEHGYTMNRMGQPISAAAAPLVHYTNTGGNAVNVDLAAGQDTLNVVGNALAQTFDVDVTTSTVAIDDAPVVGNDGTVTYTNNESLGVFGLEGDDTFDVTPGAIPVFIDGGDPIGESAGDTINTNAGGAAVTFEAGPENDEGGILVAGSERISYDHIEALGAIAAMKALIIGTNGDDDITVIARDASTHVLADGVQDFTVSVNAGPAILFVDTPELYIDALSGDDDIVLRTPAPNDAAWDVEVFVSGGAPSDGASNEGDRLVLETPGNDTIIYTPTGSDTGTILIDEDGDGINDGVVVGGNLDSLITIGQFNVVCPGLDYTSDPGGVELFEYDGEGANDVFTIVAPAGDDTIVHTPGSGFDEGALRVNTTLAVNYQNLGVAAVLTVADTGGNDTLVANGTGSDDAFDVAATTGAVTLVTPSAAHLAINQTQVENLTLDGLDGNDDFVINQSQPYANINVFGGGPGGSDVLTVNGAVGTDEEFTVTPAFDRGDGQVDVVGGGVLAIPYVGVEHVALLANAGDTDNLTVNDDAADNLWTVDAGPIFGDRIQIDDRESIDFVGFNDVDLNNGFGADIFTVFPANLIGFSNELTANSSGTGQDVLHVVGTEADDTFTSDADTITLGVVNVTAGDTGFAEVRVSSLGGADSITLSLALAGVRKVVDGGAEDDNINVSTMQDATIFGGLGDDIIIGSPLADLIYGGSGNDTISGLGGDDTIYGGDGNDTVTGGTGSDRFFGGDGSDLFIWNQGDGSDLIEGDGGGADVVRFNGATGAAVAVEDFTLSANTAAPNSAARLLLARTQGGVNLDIAGVEQIDINGDSGVENITVNDVTQTELQVLNLDLGNGGDTDTVNVQGRNIDDNLQLSLAAGVVNIAGLEYDINVSSAAAEPDDDRLTVFGNQGNDVLTIGDGVEGMIDVTLNGGVGNDHLTAGLGHASTDTILNGDAGDDLLRGGSGNDTINGGAGEDTMVGGLGLDTFDGGSGFDTILVEGFASDDRIDVRQDNPTTLRHEVGNADNGFDGVLGGAGTETDTLAINTVEQVSILAAAGDDTIRVAHDDSLVAAGVAADMLRFNVDGGDPGASDRLTVIDDGLGDTNVQRLGQTDGDGSFTTYAFAGGNPANPIIALPPVVYTDVEYASLNPIGPVLGGTGADGNGRLFVFKYDPFEQNQSLPTATFLGADSAINLDPNIDPGVDAVFGTPGDEDWYRVVADKTGTLDFQVYFRQQGTLANNRAGLPNGGNLDIAVFDADGLVNGVPLAIAGNGAFGNNDSDNDERVRIPAVAGQTYYLRVVGAGLPVANDVNASPAINAYNVSVVNDEPATPFDLELADNLTILTGAQEVPAVATSSNGTANFQYNAAANTFNLDLFVAGLELTDTTSQPELLFAHIHRAAVGVNGPVIVTLSAGIGGWVQEPSGIRLKLNNAPFSGAAGDITALLAGNTYINVHSTANPGGEVRGQILIQNVLGVSDSGRSQFDNVTQDNTPTILLRLDDALLLNDLPGNAAGVPGATPPDQLIPIPHNPSTAASPVGLAAGYRVAIYDETDTHNPVFLGFAQPIANLNGVYSFTFTTPLAEGSHFISSRVQMIDPADNDASNVTLTPATGFGPRGESLEIIVDTPPPPVSFGDAAVLGDGLHPDSDSGDAAVPATLVDRITNDTTPTFFGRAEANAIVRLYVDVDGNSIISPPDVLIGQTVAVPTDGTNQSPNGEWEITSTVDMNDPNRFAALGVDGARKILVQAEDLAGNLSGNGLAFELDIFLDTRGPQVTGVFISNRPDFDLFTLKPETPEPTPRVDSITINVQDLPARVAAFLYPAISNLAVQPNVLPLGLIQLVGDHSGIIPMTSVLFTSDGDLNLPGVQPLAPGNPATGFITLQFAEPLPDDRFTLTLSDSIIDPAGNALDGESNASEPVGTPLFPSGDGIPGGDFIARFTVDSRPEVGTWSQELVYVDINGNFVWDPEGQDNDATNRDFIYHFGTTTDAYFAGNFNSNFVGPDGIFETPDDAPVLPDNVPSSGFDKMGTFGRFNGQYEFFLDTNDDGVGDTVGPMFYQVNVIPVAGNFFNSTADNAAVANGQRPRDEIGGFDGQNWYLDVNGDNEINAGERFATELRGIPVVGDFNGDGNDDLATFNNDTGVFQFDLDRDGTIDDTLTFFFSGFGEKPVAGDVNLDGVDDIVLWVPNRDGQLPENAGEFHYLVSDNPAAALPSAVFNAYSPAPLGNDLIAQFGDDFALPILGNFDPPIGDIEPVDTAGWFTNLNNSLDVDNDGFVDSYDALLVINALNRGITSAAPSQAIRVQNSFNGHFLDVDGSQSIDPYDALLIINELNRVARAGQGEAAPSTAASYAAAVDSVFSSNEDEDDLLLDFADNDALRNTL